MFEGAYVGVVGLEGDVDSIYVERGGQIGEAGILLLNYTEQKEVDRLIALGDLARLGATPNDCVSFYKDRDEPIYIEHNINMDHFFQSARVNDIKYIYLYREGKWKVTSVNRDGITYPPMRELDKAVFQHQLGLRKLQATELEEELEGF